MNILVLNAGSSSQKSRLYSVPDEGAVLPNTPPPALWKSDTDYAIGDRAAGLVKSLRSLWKGKDAPLSAPEAVAAVGHRVVHGGQEYREPVRITPEVIKAIERLAPLAPAHNPAALDGIRAAQELLGPTVPQFAVFDTAFHHTLPPPAFHYPGPYAWIGEGIRRYGFHGISHEYVAGRAAHLLGRDLAVLRLITCHLGNGCSLAAIQNGRSVDTTMGFTPLDGLMMGSRSGAIDPGILLYLLRENKQTPEQLDTLLNRESGLKGISGVSSDMREIKEAIAGGNDRARIARDMFVHSLRCHIGAMRTSLDGLDALIFTAGIGEHDTSLRAAACEGLDFLGVRVDGDRNARAIGENDEDIADAGSPTRVLVILTEEDWAIARQCYKFLTTL